MCGIGGQFAYQGQALSEDLAPLERMSLRMRPRGPDGSGMFVSDDHRIGFVHRRLAIIDLSEAGAQPMRDPSTGLTIVFNGEITTTANCARISPAGDMRSGRVRIRKYC
jgi:asparagine synthase (glutamine-hydrolysing)